MRYVLSRCRLADRDEIYRIYVTEGIRVLCGGKQTYFDLVAPLSPMYEEETRTPEEIIEHISDVLTQLGGT